MDIQTNDVGYHQEIRLSQEDLDALSTARYFLSNSCTLKNKKIVGKFLCFDPDKSDNSMIMMVNEDEKLASIPTTDVLTITEGGWIIGTSN